MSDSDDETRGIRLGDRVECAGYYGTVRYVGLLEGYAETWLGVDWDDRERGKHSGVLNGVRYFNASQSTSGTFVRPDKVRRGRSVIEAITSRYGWTEKEDINLSEHQLNHITQSINAPFLKLVGFDKVAEKQSDFNNLQVVNVRLQDVSEVGIPGRLRLLCPNVAELDISKNLLTRWSQVFALCSELVQLEWLNVSENLLNWPNKCEESTACFTNMRTLICGAMRIDWGDIKRLAVVFPCIEELRVPHNRISGLDGENLLADLKMLDLEGNPLFSSRSENSGSDELRRLHCAFPSLQQINMENVGLKVIRGLGDGTFCLLKKLVISNNHIEDWESIGELDKLASLENLRMLKNPVTSGENYETCIQFIIARIANLKVLNGAIIREEERRGAEYDYIKKYGVEWLAVRDSPEKRCEFLARHNRYEELIQRYGTPEESELAIQSTLIKESLIRVQFVHADRVVTKKLPPSMLVQKTIALAQRLFGLTSRPLLTYVSGTDYEIEIELSDESKEMAFYSIREGDKIIVRS